MSIKKALLMAIILVLGAVYVYKFEQGPSAREKANNPLPDPRAIFTAQELSALTHLEVVAEKGAYELSRADSKPNSAWKLKLSEAEVALDNERVNEVLEALKELEIYNTISAKEVDRASDAYGFSKPSMRLLLATDKAEHIVFLGNTLEITGRRYAKIRGAEEVLLVGNDAVEKLNVEPNDLRDHYPLKLEKDEIGKISVTGRDGSSYTLFQETDKRWSYEATGKRFFAEHKVIAKLLASLSSLEVLGFESSDASKLATYGLDKPALNVAIELSSGESNSKIRQLAIGEVREFKTTEDESSRKAYFLKIDSEPQVYEVDRADISILFQSAGSFREQHPFSSLGASSIKKIELAMADAAQNKFASFERAGEVWVSSAKDKSAESKQIDELVDNLVDELVNAVVNFKVVSYPELDAGSEQERGLGEPIISLRFSLDSGIANLKVGAPITDGKAPSSETSAAAPSYGNVVLPSGESLDIVIGAADLEDLKTAINPLFAEKK